MKCGLCGEEVRDGEAAEPRMWVTNSGPDMPGIAHTGPCPIDADDEPDTAGWQIRDEGSAYGHRQRVAESGTYARIQAARTALADHLERCDECGVGADTYCEAGTQLDKAHRAVENPAPVPGGAVGYLANRRPIRRRDNLGDTS